MYVQVKSVRNYASLDKYIILFHGHIQSVSFALFLLDSAVQKVRLPQILYVENVCLFTEYIGLPVRI